MSQKLLLLQQFESAKENASCKEDTRALKLNYFLQTV